MKTLPFFWAACLFVAPATAGADSFSCGQRIVQVADSAGEVQMKCGRPTWRYDTTPVDGAAPGEIWLYNFGPNDFVRLLTFVSGRLVEIKTGAHGS